MNAYGKVNLSLKIPEAGGQGFFLPRRGLDLSSLNQMSTPRQHKANFEEQSKRILKTEPTVHETQLFKKTGQSLPNLFLVNTDKRVEHLSHRKLQKKVTEEQKSTNKLGFVPILEPSMLLESPRYQEITPNSFLTPQSKGSFKHSASDRIFSKVKFANFATSISSAGCKVSERTIKKGVIRELQRNKPTYQNL